MKGSPLKQDLKENASVRNSISTKIPETPRLQETALATPLPSRAFTVARRDPSPTKLPIGGLQRSQSIRQPASPSKEKPYAGVGYRRPASKHGPEETLPRPTSRDSAQEPRPRSRRLSGIPVSTGTRDKEKAKESLQTVPASPAKPAKKASAVQTPASTAAKNRGANVPDLKAALSMEKQTLRTPANIATKVQKPPPPSLQRSLTVPTSHTKSLRPKPAVIPANPSAPAQPTTDALMENAELLQLYVLHQQATCAQTQWKASAKAYYERQFSGLAARAAALKTRQLQDAEQRNASALLDWCNANSAPVEQQTARLSRILSETMELSSPQSDYNALVQAFEHWYASIAELQKRRNRRTLNSRRTAQVVEGLGDWWHAEAQRLQGRVVAMACELLELGESEADCTLTRCIAAIGGALDNTLQELELLRGIEKDVMRQEERMADEQLQESLSDMRIR